MGIPDRRRKLAALLEQRKRCVYCTRKFYCWRPPTIDHFVPRQLGGSHKLKNLVLACGRCNTLKSGHPPGVFLLFMQLLLRSHAAGELHYD